MRAFTREMPTAITFMAPLRTNRYRSNRIRNNRRRANNFLLRLHRVIRRNSSSHSRKPAHTPWPCGRACDTSDKENREGRPGHDDRIRDTPSTWKAGKNTTHGSRSHQFEQNQEYLWKAGSSQHDFNFTKTRKHCNNRTQQAGLPHSRTGNDPTASLISIGRSRRKTVRSLLSAGSNRRGAPSNSRPFSRASSHVPESLKVKRTLPDLRNCTARTLSASRRSNNCGITVDEPEFK